MLKIAVGLSPRVTNNFGFLPSKINLAFLRLWQVFIQAPIFHHFNPERQIRIETDAFDYAISNILSQLTLEYGQ